MDAQPSAVAAGAKPENTPAQATQDPAPQAKPDLSLKTWEASKLAWHDTPQGRAGIRLFSRGILGAAAFSAGGWYATRSVGMMGYEFYPDVERRTPYGKYLRENVKMPLKIIARTIDEVAGKPIKWAVTAATGNEHLGERAVRFRPMSAKFSGRFNNTFGRSLGEEVIGITFDFFSASIGDAFGRDIADALDPNVKKSWQDDKGHIKPGEAVKTLGKTAWRYVTYNGGEDWAVALPYAYFMKGQRALLNRVSPGFKFDANDGLNGASFKVDKNANIIGNYNAVGAFDLQSRFTVYNMGTLLYREAYDWVGNLLKGNPTHLYGDPYEKREGRGIFEKASEVTKWMARGVVKGFIVMTPSVPFFWITRTPQTKYKATFINPTDQSMLTYSLGNEDDPSKLQNGLLKGLVRTRHKEGKVDFTENSPVGFRKFIGELGPDSPNGWKPIGSPSVSLNPLQHGVDLNSSQYNHGIVSSVMQPFGKANDTLREKYRNSLVNYKVAAPEMSRFINASISYTPYMYMKAEMAHMYDTGKMDMAAERLIDGAAKLNMGEFKAGLGEVWNTILQRPLKDPAREAEAIRRIHSDTSAPDAELVSGADEFRKKQEEEARRKAAEENAVKKDLHGTATDNSLDAPLSFNSTPSTTTMGAVTPTANFTAPSASPAAYHDQLSWQERMVQGKKPSEKSDVYSQSLARPPVSHAEKQKMQEILAAAVPPTNSKH